MQTNPQEYYDHHQWLYNLFWSRQALHYGLWTPGTKTLDQAIENTNLVVAEKLKLTSSDHVLDLGSGTGGTGISLTRNFGCRVTGVTISPRQKKQAERFAARAGVSNRVNFVLGNFDEQLPLPGQTFTAAVTIESFCHAHDKLKTLHQLHRWLKPGARLAIVNGFLIRDQLTPAEQEIYNTFRGGWQVASLVTITSIKLMLTNAGFRDVRSEDWTAEILPSSRHILRLGKISIDLFRWLARRNIISSRWFENSRSMAEQVKMFDGFARYEIVTAVNS